MRRTPEHHTIDRPADGHHVGTVRPDSMVRGAAPGLLAGTGARGQQRRGGNAGVEVCAHTPRWDSRPGMSASLAWRYADDPGKVVVEQPEGAASWLADHEQRRHRRRR